MLKSYDIKILLLSAAISLPVAIPALGIAPIPEQIAPVASATISSRLVSARSLFDKGNYRGTVDMLNSFIITSQLPLPAPEEQEFLYLLAASSFYADIPEAENILNEYLAEYPAGAEAEKVRLLSGDFYFFSHKWSEALEIYKTVNTDALDSPNRNLYSYRKGVALIKCGFYNEALPVFASISNSKDYALKAKYYRAYVNYIEGHDAEALKLFRDVSTKLPGNAPVSEYSMTPDFYIAQLLFRHGDWDEAQQLASSLLKKTSIPSLAVPMLRVVGMSRYEQHNLKDAAAPLSKYVAAAGEDASHDAIYALGVCLYNEGDYSEAEKCFVSVVDDHDAVGQGASLFLGQIAAQREDPSAAALNFERAYRMNYDNRVAETALYDYVAARARGGSIPFDSNIEMLEEFIRNYPDSKYAPLIERHLASLYYSAGDYDNALRVADRISRPSAEDNLLLQTILYGGGTSALSSGNPAKASRLLQRCVKISGADAAVRAQAYIWLGDALFDLGDYKEAESAYRAAEKSGKAGSNSSHLKYNLGYAQLMQNKFGDASKTFSSLLSSSLNLPADMRRDALMRVADCKYYAGNYADAKTDFASLASGGSNADYALYRHAQILGIEGDLSGKIAELTKLENLYGDSRWISNALTELADTYVSNGQNKEAAAAYSRMLDKFPVDPAAPRARLGLGAALMASGETDKGAAAYRELIRRWPASEQARIADRELKEYYADQHRLGEYAQFINSIPGYSLDASEMERLAYNVAEREYLDNPKSPEPLKKFLEDYPNAPHSAEAWSLLARHYSDASDRNNALAAYRQLEKRGGAEYAVEAYAGIMRNADNTADRAEYARRLINIGGASADILEEAEFYTVEAGLSDKSSSVRHNAEQRMRELSKNYFSEFGARSAVALGEHLIAQQRPQEALSLMEDFTSSGSGQHYWVARGFIVLADALSATGDKYTSQEYLKSLKRNYPGNEPDIQREIDKRLK